MFNKTPKVAVVYAGAEVGTEWQGVQVSLHAGEPWLATDPFVADNPDLFTADVTEVPGYPKRTSQ